MLAEFLQKVWDLADSGRRHKVVKPEGEQGHIYFLSGPDGKLDQREAAPAPRAHICLGLGSLVDVAEEAPNSTIWYSRAGVICLIDDATRRDVVKVPFDWAPQMSKLMTLENNAKSFKQREFLKFLRIDLADCMGPTGNFVPMIRNLKWKHGQDGEADIQRGKESIGRSIKSELQGPESIPERVTLDVPVFNGHPWKVKVECAVEIDPPSESFQLIPLAGQTELAIREGEALVYKAIVELLGSDTPRMTPGRDVPVYYGKP